jgi:hypothetical protein
VFILEIRVLFPNPGLKLRGTSYLAEMYSRVPKAASTTG